ncbi:TPM domain-containing protein [Corallococcus sp. Z5C101001]|nr:TPM domain-containing protein [Corallococcus sp. Z5C101001]
MVKAVLLTLLLPMLVLAQVPAITRPVTDPRGMLTPQEMEHVAQALVDLRSATQVQMAVLLVDTTGGSPSRTTPKRSSVHGGAGRRGRTTGCCSSSRAATGARAWRWVTGWSRR